MKLRWGMIGCGSAAEIKGGLGIRRSPKSELVAVADTDEVRARSYAAEHHIPRWYTHGQELVNDPAVEAVYIAAPNSFHCEYTIAAALAGKHVLCEKPFGTSVEENRRMIAACKRAGVMLAVSYYRRFYPNVQKAREIISSGSIGRVTVAGIHAVRGTVLDEPRRWLVDKEMAGGGAFQRSGSHRIDVLVYLLGPVRDVHALSERMLDGYDVEDASVAILRFESGAQGWLVFHTTVGGADETDRIEICGTRGRLLLDPLGEPPGSGTLRLDTADGKEELKDDIPEAVSLPIIDDFVCALAEGKPPICSGEEALKTNQIIYAGYRSAELGQMVAIGESED